MDSLSVARDASTSGLLPSGAIKSVLASASVYPLIPRAMQQLVQVNEASLQRALTYEALLFLLRSMSHLVGYEAVVASDQISWGGVTLYYSNYYAALAMNRLAGEAVSTLAGGGSYHIERVRAPSLFEIRKSEVNNHKAVWAANFRLYENFNWRDATLDGSIVQVPSHLQFNHPERKMREEINYHPESYKEITASSSTRRRLRSICGRNYFTSPDILGSLPFTDQIERQIATFESHAVSRQILLLAIFAQIFTEMRAYQSSRSCIYEMIQSFTRNYLVHIPFRTALRIRYKEALDLFQL